MSTFSFGNYLFKTRAKIKLRKILYMVMTQKNGTCRYIQCMIVPGNIMLDYMEKIES